MKYIVLFRDTRDGNIFNHDHHTCFDLSEAKKTVANVKENPHASQIVVYRLAGLVEDLEAEGE